MAYLHFFTQRLHVLLLVVVCVLCVSFLFLYQSRVTQTAAPDDVPVTQVWETNGTVYTSAIVDNTLYIGGTFTHVGPRSGSAAAVDAETGEVDFSFPFPYVNNAITALASDGEGGFYIGGVFTEVGGYSISRVAHIRADGSVNTDWVPAVPGAQPQAIVATDTAVYIGGSFTTVGAETRNRLAAFDRVSGELLDWNPNADGLVRTLLVSTSTIYVGGDFTSVGGSTRNRVAEISLASGAVTDWNPNIGGTTVSVWSFALASSTMYIGGQFTTVGGASRNHLVEVDLTAGSRTDWNPNPNSIVYALELSGASLYVGGNFTTIDGVNRSRVAEFDVSTATTTAWNPSTITGGGSNITGISKIGQNVYLTGSFTSVGGVTRNFLAALDADTAALTDWDPNGNTSGGRKVLRINDSTVYVGGLFVRLGAVTRNNLAAIDMDTGKATSWNPNANGVVWSMAATGTSLFVGGQFTQVGGSTRNYIAEVSTITGTSTSWNPGANEMVLALVEEDGTVYAGGSFTSLGGQGRNYAGALNASTGVLTAWNPNMNNSVWVFALGTSTIYAGGDFTSVGGTTRNKIAEVSLSTASTTSWDPDADGSVRALLINDTFVYAGGAFTSIGGAGERNGLAALNRSTGESTAWNPDIDGTVYALIRIGSTLYVGGEFNTVGEATRRRLAAVSLVTGHVTSWNPSIAVASTAIRTLVKSALSIYAAGAVKITDGRPLSLALFSAASNTAPSVSDLIVVAQANGTGNVSFTAQTDDSDNDTLYVKMEYVSGACGEYDGQTTATLSDALVASGSVVLDNNNYLGYQLADITAENTVSGLWQSRSDVPDAEGSYCLFLTADDGIDTERISSTVTVDNVPPTAPGSLALSRAGVDSVTLSLGSPSTDTHFQEYTLFYTVGNTTVTESHTAFTSSSNNNLGSVSFNGASAVVLTGLQPKTQYSVNMWAYDACGNATSSTVPLVFTTAPQSSSSILPPPPTPPSSGSEFTISNNTHTTNSRLVTLSFNSPDAMLLAVSNDSTFVGIPYEPYVPTKLWTLTEGAGIKTVYVKLRTAEGGEKTIIATIELVDIACPLLSGKPYKTLSSPAVYYVTSDCTKRLFVSPDLYFSYFTSWNEVQLTSAALLNGISNDTLAFMPWGSNYDPKYGALVKIMSDPKVYLLLGTERYWITDQSVFTALNYRWDWIEDVSLDLLNIYSVGSEIDYTDRHPNYTLIKYATDSKIYRLEPDPSDSTKQVKRHITNETVFTLLNFRFDRIVTIPNTEVYTDGAVLAR